MKILFVCKSLPHRCQGGIQTHVWKLSEWLGRFGHQVSILTAGRWRTGEQTYMLDGRQIIEVPYLSGHRSPIFSLFLEEWLFNRAAAKWLRRSASAFDIVHLQGRSGFLFHKGHIKTPVVNTLHGLIAVENRREGETNWRDIDRKIHQWWASRQERRALQNANKLIAVSDEMLDEIRTEIQKPSVRAAILAKTVKIYNGIDAPPDPSVFTNETQPNQLLFVGRLRRIKGVYPLLEAMIQLPPSVKLTFVGDGPERRNMMRFVLRNGLSEQVAFIGALPNDAVFREIRRCSALILPSFHESQGIALMEANICGKPVLASDIDGVREVVQHNVNGLLFAPHNPQAIVVAIKTLLENPNKAQRMGETGRQIMRAQFSWEQIARQTVAVYDQIHPKGATT